MISKKDLQYLEKLSKINIDESKEEEYITNLSNIIDYIKKLSEVDTSAIPAIYDKSAKDANPMRNDIVTPSIPQEDVLRNTKYAHKGYFRIPKVIE